MTSTFLYNEKYREFLYLYIFNDKKALFTNLQKIRAQL